MQVDRALVQAARVLPTILQAINYYETSLKSTNLPSLRSDLADLYLRLSQYDKAVRTLQTGLEHGPTGGEELPPSLMVVSSTVSLCRRRGPGAANGGCTILHVTSSCTHNEWRHHTGC